MEVTPQRTILPPPGLAGELTKGPKLILRVLPPGLGIYITVVLANNTIGLRPL